MAKRLQKRGWAGARKATRRISPPPELAYLLIWYRELRRQNPRGFHYEPIALTSMVAFRDLHGVQMDSFDIDMLEDIDALWMAAQPRDTPKPNTGDKK